MAMHGIRRNKDETLSITQEWITAFAKPFINKYSYTELEIMKRLYAGQWGLVVKA